MSFDIPSNHGRTQKIVEILGHVERSANANKASEDEIAAILAPAVAALRALGAIPPAITLPPVEAVAAACTTDEAAAVPYTPGTRQTIVERPEMPLSAGQRAALILADHASLRELIASLSGRLDCHAARLGVTAPEVMA